MHLPFEVFISIKRLFFSEVIPVVVFFSSWTVLCSPRGPDAIRQDSNY